MEFNVSELTALEILDSRARPTLAEAVRAGAEVYAALRHILAGCKLSTGLGDEGGFALEVSGPEEVLHLLVEAIGDAGYGRGQPRYRQRVADQTQSDRPLAVSAPPSTTGCWKSPPDPSCARA